MQATVFYLHYLTKFNKVNMQISQNTATRVFITVFILLITNINGAENL